MAYQIIILATILAYANAGIIGAPAVAVQAAPTLAYSAAPAVSHISYSSPAISYGVPLATPAITSQSQNILRSFGNLGQISSFSKSIDTPFSSVRKADVRVSNHGLRITGAAPIAYGAPAASIAYGAPAASIAYGAPAASIAYGAPAYAAPTAHLATTYHAPAAVAAAPAIGVAYSAAPAASHVTVNSLAASYGF